MDDMERRDTTILDQLAWRSFEPKRTKSVKVGAMQFVACVSVNLSVDQSAFRLCGLGTFHPPGSFKAMEEIAPMVI